MSNNRLTLLMPLMLPPQASGQPLVQSLDQLHPSLQEVIVWQIQLCPAVQNSVQSLPFCATEFVVAEIGIMNDLSYALHPAVADRELFGKGLEGTILTAMTEPFSAEHVKRDSVRVCARLSTEDKSCLWINESAN